MSSLARLLGRGVLVRSAVILGLLLVALFALPAWFDASWIDTFTSVAIYAVVSAGLVVLYGKVGMISLGQFTLLALGIWIGMRLNYLVDLPFPLLLLATGAVTGVIGVVIGLPALRLSGLFLALITLMGAGAITVVIRTLEFPNGGGGFSGHKEDVDLGGIVPMARPAGGATETGFYRYTVIVCALMFLLALAHFVLKPGRAWAAIRESEPAALAAGVNITLYKMWAFALASFMTGVAGCLLASQVGQTTPQPYLLYNNLTLIATAMIGGIFTLWGAVVAGLLSKLVPFLLQTEWGIGTYWATIIFGLGMMQVLLTAPGGIAQQLPKDLANLGRLLARPFRRRPDAPEGST
jgi:branched-chain amino acid transport system permease protein